MAPPENQDAGARERDELHRRVAQLEADLEIAREAVLLAEREQGRLHAELVATRDLWVAANTHQQQWDALLADHAEAVRQAQEARLAIETSTSWRLIQGLLTPYRWLRYRR